MPRFRVILLTCSLIANAVVGVAVYRSLNSTPDPTPAVGLSIASKPDAPAATPVSDTQHWQAISGAIDNTTYVAQLKASGFPPYVIRALLRERLTQQYASRLRALKEASPKTPYWQARGGYSNFDQELASRTELRALYREIENNTKSLLGEDSETLTAYERERRARNYGALLSSKITEIEAINRDYNEIGAQVRAGAQGVILAADREKLILLENERRADLTRLLTPEELVEFDVRNSPAAAEIRSKLRYFDATEPEFLTLYQLQSDFDARYGRDNLSGQQIDRRKDALPELTQQMAAALGPDRFATFEIMTDGNYPATRTKMSELGLPPESATEVVRVQRDTNRRADAIRSDRTLTAELRNAQLSALAKEATDKITVTLGSAENLASYRRVSSSQWLTRLTPPERSASKP